MEFFWNFLLYSFLGFCLEVIYARLTGGRRDRKRTLLLPLCPVYGIGASAILLLTPLMGKSVPGIFFIGGIAATTVEYILAVWYEKGLGVSFWDYRKVRGNLHGRICLPFAFIWGLFSLVLVYWIHPLAEKMMKISIPFPVATGVTALVFGDLIISAVMLRRSGNRDCLRWYVRGGMVQ